MAASAGEVTRRPPGARRGALPYAAGRAARLFLPRRLPRRASGPPGRCAAPGAKRPATSPAATTRSCAWRSHGATVAFVDMAPGNASLRSLSRVAERIVVLDRHVSSRDRFEADASLGDDLRREGHVLHFDLEHSGAVLTWRHFHGEGKPEILAYVEDQDLWRFELPRSREVNIAVTAYPRRFDVWDRLADAPSRSASPTKARRSCARSAPRSTAPSSRRSRSDRRPAPRSRERSLPPRPDRPRAGDPGGPRQPGRGGLPRGGGGSATVPSTRSAPSTWPSWPRATAAAGMATPRASRSPSRRGCGTSRDHRGGQRLGLGTGAAVAARLRAEGARVFGVDLRSADVVANLSGARGPAQGGGRRARALQQAHRPPGALRGAERAHRRCTRSPR